MQSTTIPTAQPMMANQPMMGQQAGAVPLNTVPHTYPTTSTLHSNTVGDPSHPPSAIKGNITSMVGKMTHNPQKEQDGNIMVANASEQKAARFEAKALQWEQKGNATKAQKNREKVNTTPLHFSTN